jgi:hypothetical protein
MQPAQNRRRLDFLQQRVSDLESRLKELNQFASKADDVMDAELRAIQASLPHYKEAVRLESARRAKGSRADRKVKAAE